MNIVSVCVRMIMILVIYGGVCKITAAHTVGLGRCTNSRNHTCFDGNVNKEYAQSLQNGCPCDSSYNPNAQGNKTNPLDRLSPKTFDINYYKDLKEKKVLLHSDQELFNNGAADDYVHAFLNDSRNFFDQFAISMIKMGDIKPPNGSTGEIRNNCRKIN